MKTKHLKSRRKKIDKRVTTRVKRKIIKRDSLLNKMLEIKHLQKKIKSIERKLTPRQRKKILDDIGQSINNKYIIDKASAVLDSKKKKKK